MIAGSSDGYPSDRIRFALYSRCSTEDHQDPASSLAWQRRRSELLIAPHGEIVTVFFDQGVSRSLPWQRRPEAERLLAALGNPDRGFDAVVIGEPQRAFYGAQFHLIFPKFVHYRIPLWVPEVGGPIDPGSEAHEMLMTVFGGQSKSERTRTRTRVIAAMEAQAATQGRFLGGRPPFGYRLVEVRPHPNPDKGMLRQLSPDPVTAPAVVMIFDMYVNGRMGYEAIAQRLTDEGVPSPSGYDPVRNPHRQASRGVWAKSAVRAILENPRYTGFQVWGRYRGHDELLDVDDVELGYRKRLRPADPDTWVWSTSPVHEAIIDRQLWEAAQRQRELGRRRPTDRRPASTHRVYALRGKVWCATCGRKMEADWHRGPRYRCRLSGPDYARNADLDETHPRTASLREATVLPVVDHWLGGLFDPANVDTTVAALLAAAEEADPGTTIKATAAKRRVEEAERKLNGYRRLLDAGTDPAVVATWIADTCADRDAALQELTELPETTGFDEEALRSLVAEFIGNADCFAEMLASSDQGLRERLYDELDLRLYFTPGSDLVQVTAGAVGGEKRVGGGT